MKSSEYSEMGTRMNTGYIGSVQSLLVAFGSCGNGCQESV
jgi:hypothetical protein